VNARALGAILEIKVKEIIAKIISCITLFCIGAIIGSMVARYIPEENNKPEITKSITVQRLLSANEVREFKGNYSGFVVISDDNISYWVSDIVFFALEKGNTYCLELNPTPPQGPFISKIYGIGECDNVPN
jgi:hypothetical protein